LIMAGDSTTAQAPVVLVVEEQSELLHVLIDALQWEGYEVLAAHNREQAEDVLRNRAVDLLVSDPPSTGSGREVLAALEAEFPLLPIVTLAEEDEEGRDVYFRAWKTAGNRRTLRRPFRLGDLIAACREAVAPTREPVDEGERGSD